MDRILKVIFTKGGSGSITTKVSIPKSFLERIGVTEDDREIIVKGGRKRIIIEKK